MDASRESSKHCRGRRQMRWTCPTIPKTYLISAIIQRSPANEPISSTWSHESKEGSKHLQVEGVCDVPFQKRAREGKEREKSQDISRMKDECNKLPGSPRKLKRVQEDYHERSSQDIKLPNLSRIFFKFVKILLSIILSSIAFIILNSHFPVHIKEIDNFFEEGQSQAIWISNLDSMKSIPLGGNTSGRKEGIFSQQWASFSITLNQQ